MQTTAARAGTVAIATPAPALDGLGHAILATEPSPVPVVLPPRRDAVTRAYTWKYNTRASEKSVHAFAEPGRAATTLELCSRRRSVRDDGNHLDLDEPVGRDQGRDVDQRAGGRTLPVDVAVSHLAQHGHQFGLQADDVEVHLDHVLKTRPGGLRGHR